MARIRFRPRQGHMGGTLTEVGLFPGDAFGLGIPESIGDSAQARWFGTLKPEWKELDDGAWQSIGREPGELTYVLTVRPGEETVDIEIALTNESGRTWREGMAFNCFQVGGSPALRDHDCVRHWVRANGRFQRLVEVPRVFGPRATVQLYSVEGARPGMEIPFVASFRATPDVALEGWMAVRAPDDRRMAAVASKPALFLFQNMEYSCIHSAPSFGTLAPGQTGRALTRIYFVEATLEEWRRRMTREM